MNDGKKRLSRAIAGLSALILSAYGDGGDSKGDRSLLVGVVENARSEQRGFHGIEELGRILLEQEGAEKDAVTAPE